MLPRPPGGLAHHQLDRAGQVVAVPLLCLAVLLRREGSFVAVDHVFQDVGGGDTWQVRTAGGHGERQGQPDQVMGGVADHRLVQVAYLHGQRAPGAGDGAEIADMAVAADPHRRALRQGGVRVAQPFVKLRGAAAHVGVGRGGHLAVALGRQQLGALLRVGMLGRHAAYIAGRCPSTSLYAFSCWWAVPAVRRACVRRAPGRRRGRACRSVACR